MSSCSGCSVAFSSSSATVESEDGGDLRLRRRLVGVDVEGDAEGDMRPEKDECDGEGDEKASV